jgi:hypothetical protein
MIKIPLIPPAPPWELVKMFVIWIFPNLVIPILKFSGKVTIFILKNIIGKLFFSLFQLGWKKLTKKGTKRKVSNAKLDINNRPRQVILDQESLDAYKKINRQSKFENLSEFCTFVLSRKYLCNRSKFDTLVDEVYDYQPSNNWKVVDIKIRDGIEESLYKNNKGILNIFRKEGDFDKLLNIAIKDYSQYLKRKEKK